MTGDEFERYRVRAKAVLGSMPIRTPCVTCETPDAKIPKTAKLPNKKCLIRQCVDKAQIVNCANCSRFPCDTTKATSGAWDRGKIEEKLGASISDEDYRAFVEPFEGLERLHRIRASLKPTEIVDPANVAPLEMKIVDFPEGLTCSKEEVAAFRAVHKLLSTMKLSSLGLSSTDSFAQQERLKSRRAHVLRFLWILGRYGKLEEGSGLVVDAATFGANRGTEKTLAIWTTVRDTVFKILSDFGVHCERVALRGFKEEDLATGTGYMRSKGWVMKMAFEKEAGGTVALEALQAYARRLDEEYGKKAFEHFSDVDMRVLLHK
jgi:hypothetical protein